MQAEDIIRLKQVDEMRRKRDEDLTRTKEDLLKLLRLIEFDHPLDANSKFIKLIALAKELHKG